MIKRVTLVLLIAGAMSAAVQACSDDPATTPAVRDASVPFDTGSEASASDATVDVAPVFDAGSCQAQASIGSASCTVCANDKCCADLGACAKSDDCYKFASCEAECKRTRPPRPAADGGDAGDASATDAAADAGADAADAAVVITYDDECIQLLCRAQFQAGAGLYDKLQQCLGTNCVSACAAPVDASDQ